MSISGAFLQDIYVDWIGGTSTTGCSNPFSTDTVQSGSLTFQTSVSPIIVQFTSNVLVSTTGIGLNTVQISTLICDTRCSSCTGPSNSECGGCLSPYTFNIVNACDCPEGFYFIPPNNCGTCFGECITCQGPLEADCIICRAPYVFYPDE